MIPIPDIVFCGVGMPPDSSAFRTSRPRRTGSCIMNHTNTDSIDIIPLTSAHASACVAIGRTLPDWFGIEEGLQELRHAAETQIGFVAHIDGEPVGFVSLEQHFPETWEITWMAVRPERHRHGVGRRLIDTAVKYCCEHGASWLLVKTLADTHPSPEYGQTRAFYRAMGFTPLQVFAELWGPHNPCLLMARTVG